MYLYMFFYVLSWQVLHHLIFKIMRNRQVALKFHVFLLPQEMENAAEVSNEVN